MSLGKSLSKILLLVVLEAGALCGVPINPRQIEDLLDTMNRTKQEYVIREENDEGKRKRKKNRGRGKRTRAGFRR